MTIKNWLYQAESHLRRADIPSARLDAELILSHALGRNRTWLTAHSDDEVFPSKNVEADRLLAERAKRIPLAYLLGYKEFYGRRFIVTPDTLIPRPETETLVELVKKYNLDGNVIDVGTGSGCLGLTIALETDSEVTLCDVSDAALEIAQKNAEQLGVKSAVFTASDLLSSTSENFDLIAANLPYVDRAWQRSPETDFEPSLALFADDSGLELIKKLIDQAPEHLNPDSHLLLEADPEQHLDIVRYATEFDLVEAVDYAILLKLR